MLTDQLKSSIQQAYRHLLDSKSLQARYGQKLMIAEIARTLGNIKTDVHGERTSDAPFAVIEAGTGTGKTIAYILAALPIAKSWDKRVVISTGTVALQEQVVYRDLPDIQRHSGLDFSFALAKGRTRYLCLLKLDNLLQDAANPTSMGLYPDEQVLEISSSEQVLHQDMITALGEGRWDGDRENWSSALEEREWQPLTAQRHECSGRRCVHVSQCSFFKARENLDKVDCIVANHDLVMSDLALGGGVILPNPDETIYIFDEGHHLPDRALRHFAGFARLEGSRKWLEHSEKQLGKLTTMLQGLSLFGHYASQLPSSFAEMDQYLERLSPMLMPLLEQEVDSHASVDNDYGNDLVYRFEHGEVPADLVTAIKPLEAVYDRCLDLIGKLVEIIDESFDDESCPEPKHELEEAFSALGQMQSRLESQHKLFQMFVPQDDEKPKARWLSLAEGPGGLIDVELNSSPIIAADHLRQYLWSRCFAAVVTSATLTALGTFDRFAARAGLPSASTFAQVPSPFDYSRAVLHLPQLACEPGDAQLHTEEIIRVLPDLIALHPGTLVLFTSRRQMQKVHEGLSASLQKQILMQGDLSKQVLIDQHCKLIDQGKSSVIFGLASFAEGVDLPGDYCRHVIIARIPFAVPNDPLEEALAESIEARGGNAFMEVSVPDAATKLIQAMGRLLRTESDFGQITLLDKRLITKRYGKMLLDSLPPFQRQIASS